MAKRLPLSSSCPGQFGNCLEEAALVTALLSAARKRGNPARTWKSSYMVF